MQVKNSKQLPGELLGVSFLLVFKAEGKRAHKHD